MLRDSPVRAQCSLHLLGLPSLRRQLEFLLFDSLFEYLVPLLKGEDLFSELLQLLILYFELLYSHGSSILDRLGCLLGDGWIIGLNFGAQDPLPSSCCRLFFFSPYSLSLLWNRGLCHRRRPSLLVLSVLGFWFSS